MAETLLQSRMKYCAGFKDYKIDAVKKQRRV